MSTKTGKGKHKTKGQTMDLQTFLKEKQVAPEGFTVVSAPKLNWAEAMEDEEIDDKFTLDYKKESPASKPIMLPTAPKAIRVPDVDLTKVPTKAPFKAYLANLPYEITEDDILIFFRKLKVTDVQLPRDGGDRGRLRGYGYAEFSDRDTLIEALSLNNETIKNRPVRVSLSSADTDNERPGRPQRDNRQPEDDRTTGDWRSAPREQLPTRETRDQRSYGRDLRNGSEYSERDNFRSGAFDRRSDDRGFDRRSDDRGFDRRSDDRGFDRRSDNRGFDREFSRNDMRGPREIRDFDRFSDRRNNDRAFDRTNDRFASSRESNFERRPPSHPPQSPVPSETASERDVLKERPKLQLKPRTVPLDESKSTQQAAPSAIFGGAKPVDTTQREREIEEKLRREKEEIEAKKKAAAEAEEAAAEKKDRSVAQSPTERVRRTSNNSTVSSQNNRSRRGSESGPSSSSKEDSDQKYEISRRTDSSSTSGRLFEGRDFKSSRGPPRDFGDSRGDYRSKGAPRYEGRGSTEDSRTSYDREFRSRNRDDGYSSNTYSRSGGGHGAGRDGGYRNGRSYNSSDHGFDGSQNRKPRQGSNIGNSSSGPRYQPKRFGNDNRSEDFNSGPPKGSKERPGPRFRPLNEDKESIEYTSQNKFTHLRNAIEDDVDDGASD